MTDHWITIKFIVYSLRHRLPGSPESEGLMYAIIECSGHQYKVEPQSIINVQRLHLDQGAPFTTDKVLLIAGEGSETKIGAPFVEGCTVKGTVVEHFRDKKIIVFKMKRRKGYRRKQGHRQEMTRLKIDAIETA